MLMSCVFNVVFQLVTFLLLILKGLHGGWISVLIENKDQFSCVGLTKSKTLPKDDLHSYNCHMHC